MAQIVNHQSDRPMLDRNRTQRTFDDKKATREALEKVAVAFVLFASVITVIVLFSAHDVEAPVNHAADHADMVISPDMDAYLRKRGHGSVDLGDLE